MTSPGDITSFEQVLKSTETTFNELNKLQKQQQNVQKPHRQLSLDEISTFHEKRLGVIPSNGNAQRCSPNFATRSNSTPLFSGDKNNIAFRDFPKTEIFPENGPYFVETHHPKDTMKHEDGMKDNNYLAHSNLSVNVNLNGSIENHSAPIMEVDLNIENGKPQDINSNNERANELIHDQDISQCDKETDKLQKMNDNNNHSSNNNNANSNNNNSTSSNNNVTINNNINTDTYFFPSLLGTSNNDTPSRSVGLPASQSSAPYMNCANQEFTPDTFGHAMYERHSLLSSSASSSSSAPHSPITNPHQYSSSPYCKQQEPGSCDMMMISGQMPEGMLGMSTTSGDVTMDEMGFASWFGGSSSKKGATMTANRDGEIVSPEVGLLQHHHQQQHLSQQHQQAEHCLIPGMAMLSSCK